MHIVKAMKPWLNIQSGLSNDELLFLDKLNMILSKKFGIFIYKPSAHYSYWAYANVKDDMRRCILYLYTTNLKETLLGGNKIQSLFDYPTDVTVFDSVDVFQKYREFVKNTIYASASMDELEVKLDLYDI